MNDLLLSLIGKRKKINEYDDLRNKLYDHLKLYMNEIKRDDMSSEITIIMDSTMCVGKFASYSIYIPKLSWVWLDDLKKIKGYGMWSVSTWNNAVKLQCSSNRSEDETTRGKFD